MAWCIDNDSFRLEQDVVTINQVFQSSSSGRRFVGTQNGCIGFVPKQCEEDDLVVVLVGGNLPCVLRLGTEQVSTRGSDSTPC
jgi:hypothetical protein